MTPEPRCPACEDPAAHVRACPSCGAPAPQADDALLAEVRRALVADFEVEGEIGRGRTAVVYRARDARLGHAVALRVLRPGLGEAASARLLGVARATARLEHPHVVPVYAAGDRDGLPFVATRYVDGCSLDRLPRGGELLPTALACAVAAQVARALEFAHAAGVVHGGLRPAHVLLDATWGHAVVAGFGASASSRYETPYAAPELSDGAPPTPASDQYALGAILWELLAGAPPAGASDGRPWAPGAPAPGCPAGLVVAVSRMLAPAPEARWPRLGDALAVLLRHAGRERAQQKELRRRLAPNAPDDTAGARSVQSPAQPRAVPPRERPTARQLRTVSAAAPAPRYVAASELCEIELPFRGDDALAARPEPPAAPHERRGGGRPRAAGSLGRRRRVAGVTAAGLAVAAMLAGVAAAARAPRGRGAAPAPTARTLAAVPPPSHRRTADGPTPAPDGGSGGAPLPAGEAAGALDPADVVRVVVEGAADSLAVGDSVRLRAALVDGRGVPRPEGEATAARIRWRSADTSRVQVSPAGWARATRAGGPVTVTAQVGSARGRRRLRVVPASGARVAAGPEWTTDLAAPAGPSTAEAESLVETFVAALRGRDVAVVGRLLEAGGAASAAEVTRWLRERRAFGAALVERGALHADGDAFAMDFRVTLSWKTRTLTDLHRGGTAHATSRTFRATLARDAAGWALRGVTPVEPFPP